MKKIKINYVPLNAGTILIWKKHNLFKELWYKIRRKELPYNRALLLRDNTEYCYVRGLKNVKIYTPIRKYNNKEINKLKQIISTVSCDWTEITHVANIIRPKTFNNIPLFVDNKYLSDNNYYRLIDVDKESKEYIY